MPRFRMSYAPTRSVNTIRYSNLRGVDFASAPTQVDPTRSPDMVNMISDFKGMLKKRLGWRKLLNAGAHVLGIYSLDGRVIVHTKQALNELKDGELIELVSNLTGESSAGFVHKDTLYILTGKEYVYVSPDKAGHVKDVAYTPISAHSKKVYTYSELVSDNFAYDMGTPFEDENILITYRRESFDIGTGVMGNNPICFAVVGQRIRERAHYKDLEVRTAQGNVIENVAYFIGRNMNINEGYENYNNPVSEKQARTVYLKSYTPERDGLLDKMHELGDNSTSFTIRYPIEEKDKNGYIPACRIASKLENRVFFSGNPDHPNTDWYSENADPTYIKEISYTEFGDEDVPIYGYLNCGDKQGIVKKSNTDCALYLRRGAWDSNDGYYFPIERGTIQVGMAAFNQASSLTDDPMYLSEEGVFALAREVNSGERVIAPRSSLINPRLTGEELERAKVYAHNGYFFVAVSGKMYIAVSNLKTYTNNKTGTFEYEWFYFEDVPCECMCVCNGKLYFGTESGDVCVFNTDLTDKRRFADWPDGLEGEPRPVHAHWTSNLSDDGDFTAEKILLPRGSGVFLGNDVSGDVKISVTTDRERERNIAKRVVSTFSFADMSFKKLSFQSAPSLVAMTRKKAKRYRAISIRVASDEEMGNLGIISVIRRFSKTRTTK